MIIQNICLGPDWTLEPTSDDFPLTMWIRWTRVHSDMMLMGCSIVYEHVYHIYECSSTQRYICVYALMCLCAGSCWYVFAKTDNMLLPSCCSSPVELDIPEMRLASSGVSPLILWCSVPQPQSGDFAARSFYPTAAGNLLT